MNYESSNAPEQSSSWGSKRLALYSSSKGLAKSHDFPTFGGPKRQKCLRLLYVMAKFKPQGFGMLPIREGLLLNYSTVLEQVFQFLQVIKLLWNLQFTNPYSYNYIIEFDLTNSLYEAVQVGFDNREWVNFDLYHSSTLKSVGLMKMGPGWHLGLLPNPV